MPGKKKKEEEEEEEEEEICQRSHSFVWWRGNGNPDRLTYDFSFLNYNSTLPHNWHSEFVKLACPFGKPSCCHLALYLMQNRE